MPADFRLLGFTPKLWTPLTMTAADHAPDARKNRFLRLFARLAPGVTLKQAQAQMQALAQQAQGDFPSTEKGWGASVRMLPDFLIHNFGIGTALVLIMKVVVFVLLSRARTLRDFYSRALLAGRRNRRSGDCTGHRPLHARILLLQPRL